MVHVFPVFQLPVTAPKRSAVSASDMSHGANYGEKS